MKQPNRVAIFIQPILAGLAGWLVVLAAKYLPGHPKLDPAELTILFGLGVSWTGVHVLMWLHGWQKHEARLPVAPPSALALSPPPRTSSGVQEIGTTLGSAGEPPPPNA